MEERKTHIIDATDKVFGRLASQIAHILRGKNRPDFVPNRDMGDFVVVKNVDKMRVSGKKMEQKKYYRFTSGYIGSLKEISFKKVFKEKPAETLRGAVLQMLPKNRLRKLMMKRLKFE
jgi:large subunit ribosomal protein L13